MKFKSSILLLALAGSCGLAKAQVKHAPAYPLITHNTYFSIWSNNDTLTAAPTQHWTGNDHSLIGVIKVDNNFYRFMGKEPNVYKTVLTTSEDKPFTAKYTESSPGEGWAAINYNDRAWKTGAAPFSDNKAQAKTLWTGKDIWMRREFTVANPVTNKLMLNLRHDDDAEVYINGVKVKEVPGANHEFRTIALDGKYNNILKKGKNVLAIHCVNTGGEAWLDAGLLDQQKEKLSNKIPVARQLAVRVNATQTIYQFKCGKADLEVTFTSPLLMNDLRLFSRPVSYISYKVKSNDGKNHQVSISTGASGDIAVNKPSQPVTTQQYTSSGGLTVLKAGSVEQPVLQKKGDDLRIDWGYMYLAAPKSENAVQYVTKGTESVNAFFTGRTASTYKKGTQVMLNTVLPLGSVGKKATERFVMLGYDDLYSVQYFKENLQPWWKSEYHTTIDAELANAAADYQATMEKCTAFDEKLYKDTKDAGGEQYAELCVMAYRQSIAAHQLLKSPQGDLLFLSKENYSNGSINTVDVTYPSAPMYLIYNPELLKGMLNGIFYYSESGRWKKDFPAHDLGTYPIANGQTYGEDMPVEEAGNMLILTDAIVKADGNTNYAKKHWATLTKWAHFLLQEGLDPANQLCTDDFAGHLARNANLSVKAIMAIGSFSQLAGLSNYPEIKAQYRKAAEEMTAKWLQLAKAGDHYSLVFERPDTWSQKYNMVWDKVLDLHLFPKEVYETEMKYYLTKQNKYGLPLDSRKTYTKSDWIMWTATLSDNQRDFKKLIEPVYEYSQHTTSRVPISDWHETTDGKMVGFQARSVVGGYFIKLLDKKWDQANGGTLDTKANSQGK
ncbi:DUF4965 domain-containing protein [Mucilaginibacter koreensis]